MQVICEFLIIQKNSSYVVAKVIMVLYYVVLGGDLYVFLNFLNSCMQFILSILCFQFFHFPFFYIRSKLLPLEKIKFGIDNIN